RRGCRRAELLPGRGQLEGAHRRCEPGRVSPLAGISTRAEGDGDVVTYADGHALGDAVATAAAADAAVVFVGDGASEGVDRSSLAAEDRVCTLFGCGPSSPISQDELVAQVAAVNP